MEAGRISVDQDLMVANKDGRPLDLTQREYELLRFLAARPGKVFSREALMENVWNYEGYVGDVRAVDVAVRRLRGKSGGRPGTAADHRDETGARGTCSTRRESPDF